MENQKQRQVEYHEREHYHAAHPRVADNSHPLVAWLNTFRLRRALEMIGEPLEGQSVLFHSLQTIDRWSVYSAWLPPGSDLLNQIPAARRFFYPLIRPALIRRALTSGPGRRSLKTAFGTFNAAAGRWGNGLVVVAWKKPEGADRTGGTNTRSGRNLARKVPASPVGPAAGSRF